MRKNYDAPQSPKKPWNNSLVANTSKKNINANITENVKEDYINYLDIQRVLKNFIINTGYATEENGTIKTSVEKRW